MFEYKWTKKSGNNFGENKLPQTTEISGMRYCPTSVMI